MGKLFPMMRRSTRLIVAAAAILAASCSSSPASPDAASDASVVSDVGTSPDATSDASVASDASPDASPDTAQACEASGNWELDSYFCDTQDITAAFQSVIPTMNAVISTSASGNCVVALTYTAPACTESERIEFKIASSTTLSFKGIDACQPASCKFSTNDAPCVVGDRKVERTGSVTLMIGGINRIKIESDLSDNLCPGPAKNIITLRQK